MQGLLQWQEAFNFDSREDRFPEIDGSEHGGRKKKSKGQGDEKGKNISSERMVSKKIGSA